MIALVFASTHQEKKSLSCMQSLKYLHVYTEYLHKISSHFKVTLKSQEIHFHVAKFSFPVIANSLHFFETLVIKLVDKILMWDFFLTPVLPFFHVLFTSPLHTITCIRYV